MKVYFVRHGETQSNAMNIHQHPETELSETGQQQAKTVANRFKKISFEVIISSPLARARQTAQAIHKASKKPLEFTPLLREMRRPTEIVGEKIDNPRIVTIKEEIKRHADDAAWHYSDEENFFDFKKRVEKFLDTLAKRSEKDIVVVSHSYTLRMIVSIMFFQDALTRPQFDRVMEFFKMKNTGITLCEKSGENSWKLIVWNDHAHLG